MFKLLHLLVVFVLIAYVYSDCSLQISSNPEFMPTFVKKFGSRKVLLPKNEKNTVLIRTGEEIEAFCVNGFRHACNRNRQISSSNIMLKCYNDGNVEYKYNYQTEYNSLNYDCNAELKCSEQNGFQLYESKRKLPNCKSMSLGVGLQVDQFIPFIFAGICYDWSKMDLKFVNYMAYRPKMGVLTNDQSETSLQINSVTLDGKLDNIQDYFEFASNSSTLDQYNFENNSLIQDIPLQKELKNYENILQVIWWRNLRLANWRTFLYLLDERSRTVTYNIYTGTSGEIIMPVLQSECQMNQTLLYQVPNDQSKAVPAYIWSYLKSVNANKSEEFVVIGYNSPFYYNETSIYLCEDICDSIEWLHSFHKLRKMATLGLIYCCHPEDVATKLNNFPRSIVKEKTARKAAQLTVNDWITTVNPPEQGILNE